MKKFFIVVVISLIVLQVVILVKKDEIDSFLESNTSKQSISEYEDSSYDNSYTEHKILIEGDEEYISQVESCLNLLKNNAIEEYKIISKYIGIISQSERSGMIAWEVPPRFDMSDKVAFHSLTWCSGSIAHDAYHSFLYQQEQLVTSFKPEYNSWAGFEAERKAIAFQLKVMKKIGASRSDIEYLKSLDGTHGDINNDGKLTKEDYIKRDW